MTDTPHHSDGHPITPDACYFVVRGQLWRIANPSLDGEPREALVKELMRARRQVGQAERAGDGSLLRRSSLAPGEFLKSHIKQNENP